jgi:hypothetical protein
MAAWHIRAITDECNTCEVCGKEELKRTVLLETAEGDQLWAGTSCAARKARTTVARIRNGINTYLNRKAAYESWFPDYFRNTFGMTIQQMIEKHGPDARTGIELTRKQYMRRNGFLGA